VAIQKPLRGFNDYLGLFTAGALRFDIPGNIAPVVDADEFIEPVVTQWSEAGLLSIDGSSFSITVPENEQWRMRYMASEGGSVLRAGFFQHVLKKPTISPSFAIGEKVQFVLAGTEVGAYSDLRGMTLDSDDRIGVRLIDSAGSGNLAVSFIIAYQKIAV